MTRGCVARFLALLGAAMLVYFVGGYSAALSPGARTAIKVALPLALLALTRACARLDRLRPWRPASLALLAASCGFLAAWLLSDRVLGLMGVTPHDARGIALAKLVDSVLVVGAVLAVARAGGTSLGDLYLRRGRVAAWATVGIASFAGFLALFLWQWSRQGRTAALLLEGAPWILMFVLANGFMEELHFRGLLLRPFEGLLGRRWANLCIALFFTLAHAPVRYAPEIVPFLAVLFVLACAWGFVIQRTGALWGAVLFHAGADLMIVLSIFRTYSAA